MRQKELETPIGKIYIYKNGQKINFEAKYFDYGMYLNDDALKRPQGLYKLYPGHLQGDGGDEFMLNIVGTFQGYTIGMGAPDSQDIEDHYAQRERVLPYETWGSTERGFEIHIIDTPQRYLCEKDFQELCFVVAWEPGTTDEAWKLISFVTC